MRHPQPSHRQFDLFAPKATRVPMAATERDEAIAAW